MKSRTPAPTLSDSDFGKIVLCAAPFVRSLHVASTKESDYSYYASIGSYIYKVKNFRIDLVLKLLVQESTNLTEIEFGCLEEPGLVKSLFTTNNITKYRLYDCSYDWYQNIHTHGIEELKMNFKKPIADAVSSSLTQEVGNYTEFCMVSLFVFNFGV